MWAMADHLWQSTLFALAAGTLTLILRNNRADHRFWLWFAASLKLLLPFSLLFRIGSHFAWTSAPAEANSGLYFAANRIGRPFAEPLVPGALAAIFSSRLIHLLPAVLAAVWLFGVAVVLLMWYLRWRHLAVAVREARPARAGREAEALRRMERAAGLRTPIAIFMSQATFEPGIFGIVRPVLLWPAGISSHFDDAHLEAIVAHEVWHVRRRDNLFAAFHMMVEAVFWFYPLVWWLGARLVHERERACDEMVVELGSDRRTYAESILKTCQYCAGLPLVASGVTGADLKKRIVIVMTQRTARQLSMSRKLLLGTAGFVTVAVPVLMGSYSAAAARSDSASQDAPANTTILQLLKAASVPGATCPNATPPADPFR